MIMQSDDRTPAQRVILRVLEELGTGVYRTNLVKLVYFIDYIYSQHEGRTLTGLAYQFDHYGPNTLDDELVEDADALAKEHVIRHEARPEMANEFGQAAHVYQFNPATAVDRLDPLAEAIIADVVAKYGHLSAGAIAEASKQTAPFNEAYRRQLLRFPKPRFDPHQPAKPRVDTADSVSLEDVRARPPHRI